MVNSSLIYEILLYLNSFYFGMFSACQFVIFVLKAVHRKYEGNQLPTDGIVLILLLIMETIRIHFGRNGSLNESGWRVITSVFLIIPSSICVGYLLICQVHTLRLEYVLCALLLLLHVTQIFYAILFVITRCRPVSYD